MIWQIESFLLFFFYHKTFTELSHIDKNFTKWSLSFTVTRFRGCHRGRTGTHFELFLFGISRFQICVGAVIKAYFCGRKNPDKMHGRKVGSVQKKDRNALVSISESLSIKVYFFGGAASRLGKAPRSPRRGVKSFSGGSCPQGKVHRNTLREESGKRVPSFFFIQNTLLL